MPRLIVLNGPPGIGKSTIAQHFRDDHPLSLTLEQDVVLGLLGDGETSHPLARELCVVMAREHLRAGYDVIVPQFIASEDYLDRLKALARHVGAQHYELVLLDEASVAESRFHHRLNDPGRARHQLYAASALETAGGFAREYERLLQALAGRPTLRVTSLASDSRGTYAAVLAHLR
jgi:predicted kinase